ncbi:basic leucine zipper transcriptional factor ATF-like isoform X2 [Rhinoraja longicauda]
MAHDSDSSDPGYSGHRPAADTQGNCERSKKIMRKERNRLAAQRSRHRQTQRVDTLHQESEALERENLALRKEVARLTAELRHITALVNRHESRSPEMGPAGEELSSGRSPGHDDPVDAAGPAELLCLVD